MRTTGAQWGDLSTPTAAPIYDELWKKVPVFHISAKQFRQWGDLSIPVIDGVTDKPRVPFDVFCIEIDRHADEPEWRRSKDANDHPVDVRIDGMIVVAHANVGEGIVDELARGKARIKSLDVVHEWLIMERSTVKAVERSMPPITTTTTMEYDAINGTGGFIFSTREVRAKLTNDAKTNLDRYAGKTLRRVLTLVHFLNDRVFEEVDPYAGLRRAERRPREVEAKKRAWSGRHYRIFLDRKRTHAAVDPEAVGTGTPHAFREYVRRHKRTLKSGRVIWIDPFVKGAEKPERPGGPPQYDAWGLDKQ